MDAGRMSTSDLLISPMRSQKKSVNVKNNKLYEWDLANKKYKYIDVMTLDGNTTRINIDFLHHILEYYLKEVLTYNEDGEIFRKTGFLGDILCFSNPLDEEGSILIKYDIGSESKVFIFDKKTKKKLSEHQWDEWVDENDIEDDELEEISSGSCGTYIQAFVNRNLRSRASDSEEDDEDEDEDDEDENEDEDEDEDEDDDEGGDDEDDGPDSPKQGFVDIDDDEEDDKDPCETFDIEFDSKDKLSDEERSKKIDNLKKKWKKEALKWHPDRNKDNKDIAEKKFKEISEAYQVLSNEDKKKFMTSMVKKLLKMEII